LTPKRRPFPFDGPSPDIATALLKATRWNAVAAIYRHFIIRFGDDDNGKKEPLDFERAKQGIDAVLVSSEAFHLNPAVKLIVPNVSCVAYW